MQSKETAILRALTRGPVYINYEKETARTLKAVRALLESGDIYRVNFCPETGTVTYDLARIKQEESK